MAQGRLDGALDLAEMSINRVVEDGHVADRLQAEWAAVVVPAQLHSRSWHIGRSVREGRPARLFSAPLNSLYVARTRARQIDRCFVPNVRR